MSQNTPPIYNGRYELRNQIARGGTAQVYLAHDILLDRPVALKVLYPELSADASFVERFRREAQAAANLSHPNIVPIFDWGESGSTYFIVMEYIDGEPLSSIIHTQAPIDVAQAANVAADIAKALGYAHRHGVVHRDIKPGNVLITQDGQVKVTDFGIARAIGADEQVTQSGLVMGTATYFSPEQAQGLEVDGRSDIYSLGVVLYEMVTGRTPFSGETPVAIAYQHVREQAPPPRSVNPAVPSALEAIIMQAMAKLPAERYRSADDMKADLDRFVRGQTVLAAPPTEAFTGPATEVLSAAEINARLNEDGEASSAESERRATNNRKWAAAGGVLLIAIILVMFLGGQRLGYFGGAPFFNTPNVIGMKPAAAIAELDRAKLHVIQHHVAGTINNQHTVIHQSPPSSDTVRSGDIITLTVADAAPSAQIPNVLGRLESKAISMLKNAGFKTREIPVASLAGDAKQFQIVKQAPNGGVTKPKGTTVTISYVQNKKVKVPSVLNDNLLQAGNVLSKNKLNSGTITYTFDPTVPLGDVVSSSPTIGTVVQQGTAIDLVLSQGPGVTVPLLVGDSETQAIATIQGLGLIPLKGDPVATQTAGYVGNVALQSVLHSHARVGDEVAPGSTIVYRLGVNPNVGPTGITGNTGIPTTTTTTTIPPG